MIKIFLIETKPIEKSLNQFNAHIIKKDLPAILIQY